MNRPLTHLRCIPACVPMDPILPRIGMVVCPRFIGPVQTQRRTNVVGILPTLVPITRLIEPDELEEVTPALEPAIG